MHLHDRESQKSLGNIEQHVSPEQGDLDIGYRLIFKKVSERIHCAVTSLQLKRVCCYSLRVPVDNVMSSKLKDASN